MTPDPERAAAGTPPRISVVVSAFTAERIELISKAIDSLRRQTVPPHEIMLVIDHSPALEQECRKRWPEIGTVPNREERGLSGARNTGIAECSGDVVAFLDDDAVAQPDWIERLGRAYESAAVLGVGGTVRPDWAAGRPRWFPTEFDWVVGCTHSGMPQEQKPVRNPVGANMSFRREVLDGVGGFRHEMGRVGTISTAGGAGFTSCDETELCIRITEQRPEGVVLFDPAAAVDHFVPAERASLRYFISRCRGEGHSKLRLTTAVGSQPGLSEERSYVRKVLPAGFLRYLGELARGDVGGAARAAMLVVGLVATAHGYLAGRVTADRAWRRHAAAARDPDAPLRLLMVTPRNPNLEGGVERHVTAVAERLARAGVEVEVLCAEPGAETAIEKVGDRFTIRTVGAWPENRDWRLAPRIWHEMARERWDVVHVQSYHTFVAPIAMLRALMLGIPYVVTFHGGGHSSPLRNRLRRAQRLLMRPLLARAARLVAVARFEIDDYGHELGLSPSHFTLIPNGVDLAFTQAAPQRNGELSVASIGRLERYKGHHRVIAAFPEVLRHEPAARLTIVGTGPHETALRRQVDDLAIADRVEFTSIPPDRPSAMAELLRRTSVVVLMSEFETHPLTAIEAAAASCRLIVSAAGGLAELAEEGFARVVPLDESPEALGTAVAEELVKPPQRLRQPKLISWDECATRLYELYRSIA